jgi:hypothetical protein
MPEEPWLHPPADAPIDLQLDRAEFAGQQPQSCAACGAALAGSYYEINGRISCAACHERVVARFAARPGAAGFLRAAGAGLGAAVAGAAIYFAVQAATGYSFGLISILVGFMVGKAVHWGARGHGGRPYQALAVLLTYLAIVSTYVPAIVRVARAHAAAKAAPAAAATPAAPAAAATQAAPAATGQAPASAAHRAPSAPSHPRPRPGLARYVTAWLFILGLAAALPFMGAVGLMGLVVIAVGLFEAWKLNQRPRVAISGPHVLTPPGWRA